MFKIKMWDADNELVFERAAVYSDAAEIVANLIKDWHPGHRIEIVEVM